MSAPTNLSSKLSRAICNYLVTAGAVAFDRCFWQGSRGDHNLESGPIVEVTVGKCEVSPTIRIGNRSYQVFVAVSGKTVRDPSDTNPETERVTFDAQVGAITAVLVTDDARNAINAAAALMPTPVDGTDEAIQFAENNADMADFTILEWYDNGDGQFDVEPGNFGTQLEFIAVACESAVT